MRPRRLCQSVVMIAGFATFLHGAAAGQTAPAPAIQDTLKRVAADLFSATPHPAEAIRQLKAMPRARFP